MVVMKFLNPAAAAEFAEEYNGKPFNSMEVSYSPEYSVSPYQQTFFQPEICHVVHVLSVVIDVEDTVSQTLSRMGSPQANVYELPTCPVCLERMDSAVTGLITVPCSHTFHCMCLSKWGDSRCVFSKFTSFYLHFLAFPLGVQSADTLKLSFLLIRAQQLPLVPSLSQTPLLPANLPVLLADQQRTYGYA